MKVVVALALLLGSSSSASAESIVFASEHVASPTRIVQIRLDGRAAKVIAPDTALARSARGDVATASGNTLSINGKTVITVKWPVDDADFSPDGKLVAFTAASTANCGPSATKCATWELWLVRSNGTGLRELAADGKYPRFSADGRYLAFLGGFTPVNEGGTAVIQSLADGKRTWLTYAVDQAPVWSRQGHRLLYSSGRVRIGSVAPRRVVTLGAGYSPRFSPDDKRVAYNTAKGIVVGGKLVGPNAADGFLWSPSGWIIYVTSKNSYPVNDQLFRVRGDGSSRKLIRRETATAYMTLLGVSSTSVTVDEFRSRNSLATIQSVDLSTGTRREIKLNIGADNSPTVSASGALAYAKGSPTRFGWYCLFAAGRCLTRAQTPEGAYEPQWSPDGRQIAVLNLTRDGKRQLLVVDPVTGAIRIIYTFQGRAESPSWSPDGKTIALSVRDWSLDPLGGSHLHLIDVATGKLREVPVPATDDVIAASFAPDGRTIGYVAGPLSTSPGLKLYDLATGQANALGVQATDARPAWSPGGSRLAYQAPDQAIHVIARDGTGDAVVADDALYGTAIAWVPLTADGPLFVADPAMVSAERSCGAPSGSRPNRTVRR